MITRWINRINVIIPLSDTIAINAMWSIIDPGGDPGTGPFGVSLSATGAEPATHAGISTAATEEARLLMVDTYAAELASADISAVSYTENDWSDFIAGLGLKIIEVEL